MSDQPISREAKLLIELGKIGNALWKARDRCRKLGRERNHWKRESLLQARLLAMSDVREERLRTALQRLADCDWVITLPDRMDAVRKIAREALQ